MYVCTTNSTVRSVFQCTSALKDKSVGLPTLEYIQSRSLILQNALLLDPSDPKSKLTF
jgi:hypothetical protein